MLGGSVSALIYRDIRRGSFAAQVPSSCNSSSFVSRSSRVGAAPITGNWQVGYTIIGADTLVQINSTGSTAPEMEILLLGYNPGLTAADFVL